jgi:hypothetical protein
MSGKGMMILSTLVEAGAPSMRRPGTSGHRAISNAKPFKYSVSGMMGITG